MPMIFLCSFGVKKAMARPAIISTPKIAIKVIEKNLESTNSEFNKNFEEKISFSTLDSPPYELLLASTLMLGATLSVVGETGLEPAQDCSHYHLKACPHRTFVLALW
ncbi:MAG: hypothetical protein WC107_05460 [Patescibacteria group bacterium]